MIKISEATPLQEAKELLDQAKLLCERNQRWKSRIPLAEAIAILEIHEPNSELLASAYVDLSLVHFFVKCRRKNRKKHQELTIFNYENAIAVWERNGNAKYLSINLNTISTLYYGFGDVQTALARATRALELAKIIGHFDDESVPFWNKVASFLLVCGRVDEAEQTIYNGFATLGRDRPSCRYLWATYSQIMAAHAKAAQEMADKLASLDRRKL